MSNIFILGIIYGVNDFNKKYIEAVNVYDVQNKIGYLQSFKRIADRYLQGEPIIGLTVKNFRRVTGPYPLDFEYEPKVYLDKMKYDFRKLSEIDGDGRVLKQGKDVIIGMKEIEGELKCVVIDNYYNIRYISREKAIEEKLVGVTKNSFFKESKVVLK